MFAGLGKVPSFNGRGSRNDSNSNGNNRNAFTNDLGDRPLYFIGKRYVRFYFIDYKVIAFEVLISLLSFLMVIALFLFGYESVYPDLIPKVKSTYYILQFICIFISFISVFLVSRFSKDRDSCISYMKVLFMVSFILMLIFITYRFYLDSVYTNDKFEDLLNKSEYSEYINTSDKRLSVNSNGLNLVSEKEAFIEDNIQSYSFFKARTYCQIGLYFLVVLYTGYTIYLLTKRDNKRDKLEKDDAILFDEEENVKF